MKICFKCGAEKPLSEYYKHSAMADGHLNKCKICTKKDALEHREKNIDKIRAYDRNRPNKRERCTKQSRQRSDKLREDPNASCNQPKLTQQELRDKRRLATQQYRKLNPEKYLAHRAVNNAVRDGKLFKPLFCEMCGEKSRLHGHHEDYNEPLSLRWLCASCHITVHINARGRNK